MRLASCHPSGHHRFLAWYCPRKQDGDCQATTSPRFSKVGFQVRHPHQTHLLELLHHHSVTGQSQRDQIRASQIEVRTLKVRQFNREHFIIPASVHGKACYRQ